MIGREAKVEDDTGNVDKFGLGGVSGDIGKIADLIKGGIAAMKIKVQEEENTELAMDMLDRIQVKQQRGTITVRFLAKEADMERIIESMREQIELQTKELASVPS